MYKRDYWLTMWNKKREVLIILCLFLFSAVLQGQNIFGVEATNNYADFLKNKQEYDKAAAEYERLLFLDSAHTDFYKRQLITCYFHLNDINSIYKLDIEKYNAAESKFVFKAYLKNNLFQGALSIMDSSNYSFNAEQADFNRGLTYLLMKDFNKAHIFLSKDYSNTSLQQHTGFISDVNNDIINYKGKSPFLAATLSAIIPSSGRLYTKDYADAALNFIFISVTAIQAYRGFTNPDIGQWQGWLYGGLSASFYIGNVFGSWTAAKRYNKKYYDEKLGVASRYIFDYY